MRSSVLSILHHIYRSQPATRRAICDQTGLSANHVSTLVAQLIRQQLVYEETPDNGNRGRPATLLFLNATVGRVVGLDIGGKLSRAVLSDLHGNILASIIHPTQAIPEREVILENIAHLVEAVCREGSTQPADLAALGIGVRAIVNTQQGVILDWPNTPSWAAAWRGVNLVEALGNRLGGKRMVVDDAMRGFGMAAYRFGPARGSRNFLYVFLGSGVGSVIFVDGRPYQGSNGLAGELGHGTIEEGGPWCSCGSRGCLETLASTSAVLQRVEERLTELPLVSTLRRAYEQNELTLTVLIEAARAGDKLAFQILDETGVYVGKVIANALNLLAPELIILGGPLAQDNEVIMATVQRQVRLRSLQYISNQTRFAFDNLDELAGAQGMALLAIDSLFNSEAHLKQFVASIAQV
jgi:predicted NBD/HSP70 family sugar kinase